MDQGSDPRSEEDERDHDADFRGPKRVLTKKLFYYAADNVSIISKIEQNLVDVHEVIGNSLDLLYGALDDASRGGPAGYIYFVSDRELIMIICKYRGLEVDFQQYFMGPNCTEIQERYPTKQDKIKAILDLYHEKKNKKRQKTAAAAAAAPESAEEEEEEDDDYDDDDYDDDDDDEEPAPAPKRAKIDHQTASGSSSEMRQDRDASLSQQHPLAQLARLAQTQPEISHRLLLQDTNKKAKEEGEGEEGDTRKPPPSESSLELKPHIHLNKGLFERLKPVG
jgi:hypothetical protein